jgi:hypothetical protein
MQENNERKMKRKNIEERFRRETPLLKILLNKILNLLFLFFDHHSVPCYIDDDANNYGYQ